MKAGKPLTRSALKNFPLPPVVDGDKETKGRILIIAGCRELAGAALLVADAAMRAGAGKLRMVTVDAVAIGTSLAMPEAMVLGLEEARDGGFTRKAIRRIGEEADRFGRGRCGPRHGQFGQLRPAREGAAPERGIGRARRGAAAQPRANRLREEARTAARPPASCRRARLPTGMR